MSDIPNDSSDLDALFQAFVMIVVSEIGDKTFLIAAIMATRHPRITVFGGAFASLVLMSILSAAMGKVILGLIPKVWTLWAAGLLFLVFGLKMLQESLQMEAGKMQEEMREVEEELQEDSSRHDTQNARGIPLEDVEEGRGSVLFDEDAPSNQRLSSSSIPPSPSRRFSASINSRSASPHRSNSRSGGGGPSIHFPLSQAPGQTGGSGKGAAGGAGKALEVWRERARGLVQGLTNPVFAQAFILTFLGEWGDRSQITTIAMGGAHSVPVIAFGTILGHGLCTLGAVMGGRYLSTKISVKHISLIGAAAFLIFAVLYAYEAWNTDPSALVG